MKTFCLHIPFKYSLKCRGAYLCFFVTYHSGPPLAGRQIEVHSVPADSSFETGRRGARLSHGDTELFPSSPAAQAVDH